MTETLVEHGVAAPVLPLAFDERWFKPALLADVLAFEGFTGAAIAARIQDRLRQSKS